MEKFFFHSMINDPFVHIKLGVTVLTLQLWSIREENFPSDALLRVESVSRSGLSSSLSGKV